MRLGLVGLQQLLPLRQPKVQNLCPPLAGHHDVLGLHIPVHNANLVRCCQPLRNLGSQLQCPPQRHRVAREHRPQGLPLDELRHQIRNLALPAYIVERHNIRVIQGRDRSRLSLETIIE